MRKSPRNPFYLAGIPLIAVGGAFAAVGASGQSAFGSTSIGLLLSGIVLLAVGYWSTRNQA